MTNSILNEYYGQTKGSNISLASDDFWYGFWLSEWFNKKGGDGQGNGGCCTCFLAITCIAACLTGNLCTWFGGVKDLFCGTCGFCVSCCDMSPEYDAGASGCDQACNGLSSICCI